MKSDPNKAAPSGFSINDALFIVFKHKWKIILLTLVGLACAAVMYTKIVSNPSYESLAKLNIRYVVERVSMDHVGEDQMRGGGLSTEVELLTSRDTAVKIAEKVGPEKLLPDAEGPVTAEDAAGAVAGGLTVKIPRVGKKSSSNMLYLSYRHADPELAKEVLGHAIKTYFEEHLRLHRSTEVFTEVARQTDKALANLRRTEEEINRIKAQSGVLTIEATMGEFEARRQVIRDNLLAAEFELAAQAARVEALEQARDAKPIKDDEEIKKAVLPQLTAEEEEAERQRSVAMAELQDLQQRLEMAQQSRNQLLLKLKPTAPSIRSLDRQIRETRRRKMELSAKYPEFAGRIVPTGGSMQATSPILSLDDERAIESALKAKLEVVKNQDEALTKEVAQLSALGFKLQELERRRSLEDKHYRHSQSRLEEAKIDETLDPSKMPNIKVVQSPSPPLKSIDEESKKMLVGVAGSGLILGLAIAFLLEMVIDRRVSRPMEIETRLQLPLMMSIPMVRSKDNIAKLIGSERELQLLTDAGEPADAGLLPGEQEAEVIPHLDEDEHFIVPYASAIRDRIVFNFNVNNINHKPKLVAVTGLSSGAGTSTVAAGVAKAFTESEGRKVLLVDMNPPATGPALEAKPTDSLIHALQLSKQEEFHNSSRALYFASAPTRRDGRERRSTMSLAPTRLHELMPYLAHSDFDYIIFDMPPVSPTSPTQAMAGFMDKVLLVLDADNTTKESLQWGYSELGKGRADVSCVYNKARSHAPRWIEGAA